MVSELTRAFQRRQTINPRTVLGFYATVLGLLLTACVAGVAVLATTKTSTYLIPWLLGFAALMVLLLLGGVFLVTLNDPTKLMLGQISGMEYAEIRRAVIGDSVTGERVITTDPQWHDATLEAQMAAQQALPSPVSEGEEEEEEE